jgi:HEAT repeat protein
LSDNKAASEDKIDILINILHFGEATLRDSAAYNLSKFKTEKVLIALLEAIPYNTGESYEEARCEIADGLANFRDIRAEKALLSLTYDSDVDVRFYAIDALGVIKDTTCNIFAEQVDRLVTIVNDTQEERKVRGKAIEVLGVFQYNSNEVVSAIQSVLEDQVLYSDRDWFAHTLSKKAQEALRLITEAHN